MAKASGIVLIIAAMINFGAAIIYLGGGAITTIVTGIGIEAIEKRAEQAGKRLSLDQETQVKQMHTTGLIESSGLFAFGVFLLVSVGVLIAGAVFLFKRKNPKFIYTAGAVALLAELIGMVLTSIDVTNVAGLAGGVMAIVVSYRMRGDDERRGKR